VGYTLMPNGCGSCFKGGSDSVASPTGCVAAGEVDVDELGADCSASDTLVTEDRPKKVRWNDLGAKIYLDVHRCARKFIVVKLASRSAFPFRKTRQRPGFCYVIIVAKNLHLQLQVQQGDREGIRHRHVRT
jgi:hypothetical protein